MRGLAFALVTGLLLPLAACEKQPPYADDTGGSDSPEPVECSDWSLARGQDLGPADFLAAETEEPWLDRASPVGPGGALGDVDGDGWLDLVLAIQQGSTFLLRNDGAGQLQADAGVVLPAANSAAAADLDGDGDLDLFLGTTEGQADLLLFNDGSGAFGEPVELPESTGHTTTGAFADHDLDGDLDLVVTRYVVWPDYEDVQRGDIAGGGNIIYDNDGSGVFTVTQRLPEAHLDDLSHQAQWVDIDDDADLDLYLSNDFGMFLDPNKLFLNDGAGNLSDAGADCNCELAIEAMGVAVGDVDGTGTPDLFVTDIGGNHLLINEGGGVFYDSAKASGLHLPLSQDHMSAWGTLATDLDLDGDIDLPVVYGPLAFWDEDLVAHFWDEEGNEYLDSMSQQDALWLNTGAGDFEEVGASAGFEDERIGKALIQGDLDRDGRPDLVTIGWTTELEPYAQVHRGEGGCGGVTVQLPSGATGARVSVETEAHTQVQWLTPSTTFSSSAHEVYLGLGEASSGRVHLRRPDGTEAEATLSAGDTWAP